MSRLVHRSGVNDEDVISSYVGETVGEKVGADVGPRVGEKVGERWEQTTAIQLGSCDARKMCVVIVGETVGTICTGVVSDPVGE